MFGNAAVGATRAVTDEGWRPHSDQIGQTGLRIAPDLYIACGISGATQHIVGCKGAKRILGALKGRTADERINFRLRGGHELCIVVCRWG